MPQWDILKMPWVITIFGAATSLNNKEKEGS
jgi:hypothetical protein